MKYQRYKYNETDIATLVETATNQVKPCTQVFEEGDWPFSINVLNRYLVGRSEATTSRLKEAIARYKSGYSRYGRLKKVSDSDMVEIIRLRKEGLSLSQISAKVGIKSPAIANIS